VHRTLLLSCVFFGFLGGCSYKNVDGELVRMSPAEEREAYAKNRISRGNTYCDSVPSTHYLDCVEQIIDPWQHRRDLDKKASGDKTINASSDSVAPTGPFYIPPGDSTSPIE